MRIISGKYKGKKLFIPQDKNTRPLKDLVKESIFNKISHSKIFKINLENKNILDLFSGTGSFGIECLSRNVNKVTFVENNENAFNILSKNINKLKVSNKANIVVKTVTDYLSDFSEKDNKFEIIFLDPPFAENNYIKELDLIWKKKIYRKNHIIIIHREKNSLDDYILEFYGTNTEYGTIIDEFSLTASVPHITGNILVSAPKRIYAGASRTNTTGTLLKKSNAKVSSVRYWLDYLTSSVIQAHARDALNFGSDSPYKNSYLFKTGIVIIKDLFVKIYYKFKCKCKSCYKNNDIIVINKI